MAGFDRTDVQPCSTQLIRPGEISWEGDVDGHLAGFYVYGDGQRIRLTIHDARIMLNVLDACLRLHDSGDEKFVRTAEATFPDRF